MVPISVEQKEMRLKLKQKTAMPLLWIGIVSIVMVFAALTSAVIVSKGSRDWVRTKKRFVVWSIKLNSSVIDVNHSGSLGFSFHELTSKLLKSTGRMVIRVGKILRTLRCVSSMITKLSLTEERGLMRRMVIKRYDVIWSTMSNMMGDTKADLWQVDTLPIPIRRVCIQEWYHFEE